MCNLSLGYLIQSVGKFTLSIVWLLFVIVMYARLIIFSYL